MGKLFQKVPQSKVQVPCELKPGYIRIFQHLYSAAFLILIEQLAIQDRKFMLYQMLEYIQENPFHQYEPLKMFYYRHCVYHLKSLVGKIYAGLNTHRALQLFYDRLGNNHKGFAMALQMFTFSIFQKAGFSITTISYKTNYEPITLFPEQKYELILIELEHATYGCLLQAGFIMYDEIEQPQLKVCFVCGLEKPDLANNLFCSHRYCVYCMKRYFFGYGTYKCPISGCNAKVIGRLLRIKNMAGSNSKPQSQREIQIKEKKNKQETKNIITQFITDDWPPKFKGNYIPGYIETQYMQMRKIFESTVRVETKSVSDYQQNQLYCGGCLMSLWDNYFKSNCGKHQFCIKCQITKPNCLLCQV